MWDTGMGTQGTGLPDMALGQTAMCTGYCRIRSPTPDRIRVIYGMGKGRGSSTSLDHTFGHLFWVAIHLPYAAQVAENSPGIQGERLIRIR